MEFIKINVEPVGNDGQKLSGINGKQRFAFVPSTQIKAIIQSFNGSNTVVFESGYLESMNYKFISLPDEPFHIYKLADCIQSKK